MNEPATAKSACENCGVHLEHQADMAGSRIACPACGEQTTLGLAVSPEPGFDETEASVPGLTPAEIAQGFGAKVSRSRLSLLYQTGLLFVTAAMVSLPVIYVAMIGATGWLDYLWATRMKFLVESFRGGLRFFLFKAALYIGPLVAGCLIALFMVKPLFAKRRRRAQPLALNPGAEPALFAFIAAVCETVGAPMPKRINLDCEFNASSCFMSRQMEFDADSYQIKVGGSEAFESAMAKLELYSVATQAAYKQMRSVWNLSHELRRHASHPALWSEVKAGRRSRAIRGSLKLIVDRGAVQRDLCRTRIRPARHPLGRGAGPVKPGVVFGRRVRECVCDERKQYLNKWTPIRSSKVRRIFDLARVPGAPENRHSREPGVQAGSQASRRAVLAMSPPRRQPDSRSPAPESLGLAKLAQETGQIPGVNRNSPS
jgi:hypothetical protein